VKRFEASNHIMPLAPRLRAIKTSKLPRLTSPPCRASIAQ
jgi:hypothetical protein